MAVLARLISFILIIVTCLLQVQASSSSLNETLDVKRRLDLINKPAIKSFKTKHGEILDCVEIDKQLAFDHPLLKNHTIQMKPSIDVLKRIKSNEHSTLRNLTLSQLLPKNMICPQGTVMVKRITEEDLALEKIITSSTFRMSYSSTSNSSELGYPNDAQQPVGTQGAFVVTTTQNIGVGGQINVWSLDDVKPEQFSSSSMSVETDDGPTMNVIQAGWIVIPWLNNLNTTRMYAYWTKDSGKTTGCFNAICPGFVQVSRTHPLGLVLHLTSTYGASVQRTIIFQIIQDVKTKSWLLYCDNEFLGYWPKELFSNLGDGATRARWGGTVSSPKPGLAPAMGSGHFAEEGFTKACFIVDMELYGVEQFPSDDEMDAYMTKSNCYTVKYMGDLGGLSRRTMYFGGPPNYCTS